MTADIETRATLENCSTTADDDPNRLKLRLHYMERQYSFLWRGKDVALDPPTVRRVLEHFHWSCSTDTSNFDDWCMEFDYDPDTISGMKVYKEVQREQTNLRRLFGSDYQRFMEIEF